MSADLPQRVLGRTGLQVSSLGLGTVELGMNYGLKVPGAYGQPSTAAAIALVHAALDAGINFIDTARTYGDSEAVLGQALKDRRDGVVLATKVAVHRPDGQLRRGADLQRHMRSSLDTSLQQLQTDWVDLWQIHNVDADFFTQQDIVKEAFAAAQQAGKVRFVGGSAYGTVVPLRALAADLFDVLQVTYSVLDQRLADQVMPLAAANGVGVVVRSVLLQGVLTERGEHLPAHLAVLRQRSRQFRQLVADKLPGVTPAQAAVAFGLAQRQLGAVLVGVRTVEELRENLGAARVKMAEEVLELLQGLRVDDEALIHPGAWGLN